MVDCKSLEFRPTTNTEIDNPPQKVGETIFSSDPQGPLNNNHIQLHGSFETGRLMAIFCLGGQVMALVPIDETSDDNWGQHRLTLYWVV